MHHFKIAILLVVLIVRSFNSFSQEINSANDVSQYLIHSYGPEIAESMILRLNDFELTSSKKVLMDFVYEERKLNWQNKAATANDETLKIQFENRLNLFIPFSAVSNQIIGKP